MATTYASIYDLALTQIEDYRLDALYASSPTNFTILFNGWLMKAIPRFENCVKDLSDRDETLKKFTATLDDDEIDILSEYIVIAWLTKQINDTRQLTGMMQNGKEGRRYSEANLAKEKANIRDKREEALDNRKMRYGLSHNDWEGWSNGDFGV